MTFAIGKATYRPDYPTVAACLGNPTSLLSNTDRVGEAGLLMHQAIAIAKSSEKMAWDIAAILQGQSDAFEVASTSMTHVKADGQCYVPIAAKCDGSP